MDYTAALPVIVPAALALLAAGANHIMTKYVVSDDIDDVAAYTAHDAKHARHRNTPQAAVRPSAPPAGTVGSPTKPAGNLSFSRNPLR